MGKMKGKRAVADLEQPDMGSDSGRGFGFLATIAVLAVVGIVIWLMLNHDDAD